MAGSTTARRGDRKASPSGPRPRVLRARRRLRLPRRRTLVLTGVAAVLLGAGVVWALYGSDWLRAERVKVSGTDVLSSHQVREAADVPLGSPMVSLDTAAIERRLRKRLPRIDAVEVERSWPHTISLKVIERRPEAVIKSGGKFIEVDAKGVRFATVGRAPKGVPRLEMDIRRSPGSRRFGADRLRREAMRAASRLPAAVDRDTRVIRVRSYDSITLELTGGRTVVWGSGERGAAKADALTALMKAAPDAKRFDVSAPSAPAVADS
ncbi:cell division protein FtsQ/DivIB [Streptomyces sp. SAJ15]|uniref:cell division protein FtsQ/DivIB n=1 Tax=Streptomyces sp. SAJ15 TaxID=2011095 RepID=UPI001186929A|nr:FtsQ-type POTRA domain-containing protein [Streptomyces sp. SAJ15]TVL90886.1 cell division protein FtsQ [Streptomyces sp. SAJ15]